MLLTVEENGMQILTGLVILGVCFTVLIVYIALVSGGE
jgi:hypothetical protein